MDIRKIPEARKKFLRVLAAALSQRRVASRRNQIGPGVRRTRPKWNKYGRAKFCSGEQERARRCGHRIGVGPVAVYDPNTEQNRS